MTDKSYDPENYDVEILHNNITFPINNKFILEAVNQLRKVPKHELKDQHREVKKIALKVDELLFSKYLSDNEAITMVMMHYVFEFLRKGTPIPIKRRVSVLEDRSIRFGGKTMKDLMDECNSLPIPEGITL